MAGDSPTLVGMRELDTNRPGIRVIVDDDVAELLQHAYLTADWSHSVKNYYVHARTVEGRKRLSRIVIDVPDGMQVDVSIHGCS
jgi:hypothetical protein